MIAHQEDPAKIVKLRTGILVVVSAMLILITGLIIFNVTHAIDTMHHPHTEDSSEKMSAATEADTSWYQHEVMYPSAAVKNNVSANKEESPDKKISPAQAMVKSFDTDTLIPDKALLDAMKSPITSNQLTEQSFAHGADNSAVGALYESHDPNNGQQEKSLFIEKNNAMAEEYVHSTRHDPISRYELQAGAIIPGVLITGINSDLPGTLTGQVKSNVYDSISGNYLLIPQGAKIVGEYDAKIAYGQKRVLVVWKRIIYPNGQSLNLEGMSGVDLSGYAGFSDQVNNHYTQLLGSVVLMSALTSGAQLSQPQQSNNPFAGPSVGQTLAQSVGTNLANVGTAVVSKDLNIQPTIQIRQGYEFNIEVKKDIVFASAYEE